MSFELALTRTTKKQEIAVGVLEFKSTQTVIRVSQRLEKLHIARSKFGRQCVRLRDGNEGVPAGDPLLDVARVVWHWRYVSQIAKRTIRGVRPAGVACVAS